MTNPDVDPFAEDPITRDQWNRPRIIPLKRNKPDLKAKLVGYTRVSTFAEAVADAGGLTIWRLWHLALGLGRNPDLAALAGTYGPTVDDLSRSDKAELSAIIERAHDRSGGNVKADHGTVVHSLTEPGAEGYTPDALAADVAAYHAAISAAGLEVVDTEQFVVNDDVTCAGTYDHTVRLTRDLTFSTPDPARVIPAGSVLVLDKKTGKLHPDSQSIQIAVYANARRYDPETGQRAEIDVSREWGILAHIPKAGERCDLYLIDLRIGWAAAKLAGKVREHRTRKDIAVPFPNPEPTLPASDALAAPEPAIATSTTDPDVVAQIAVNAERYAAAIDKAQRAAREAHKATQGVDADEAAVLATISEIFPGAQRVPTVVEKLNAANSRDELSAVWREHKTDWTDEHTAALRKRAGELENPAA